MEDNTDKRVLELYDNSIKEIEKLVLEHAEKIVAFTKENNVKNVDHVTIGKALGYGDDLSLTRTKILSSALFR